MFTASSNIRTLGQPIALGDGVKTKKMFGLGKLWSRWHWGAVVARGAGVKCFALPSLPSQFSCYRPRKSNPWRGLAPLAGFLRSVSCHHFPADIPLAITASISTS